MLIRYLFRSWGCTTINQQFSFGWFPLKSTFSSTSFCLIVFFCLCSLACIKNIRDKSGGITRKPWMTIMPNKTLLKFFSLTLFSRLYYYPYYVFRCFRASIRFNCFRITTVNPHLKSILLNVDQKLIKQRSHYLNLCALTAMTSASIIKKFGKFYWKCEFKTEAQLRRSLIVSWARLSWYYRLGFIH